MRAQRPGPGLRAVARRTAAGIIALVVSTLGVTAVLTQPSTVENVVINVDADKRIGPMKPIWAWFGYDEPNYTYMKDGQKLLTELQKLSPVPVFVRTHNLLTSGDGTPGLKWGSTNAYTEDANGKPIYDWTIVDRIVDTVPEARHEADDADRVHARGTVGQAAAVPSRLAARRSLQSHLHRLGAPAPRLREVERTRLSVGPSFSGEVRQSRGRQLGVGSLE